MALTIPSDSDALALFKAKLLGKNPKLATGEHSLAGHTGGAVAMVAGLILQAVKDAADDAVPAYQVDTSGVVKPRPSSASLDDWGFALGVPSNKGAGKYGRNGPVAASGGVGTATGTSGTVVPTGAQAVDVATGKVTIKLVAGFTMPLTGTYTSAAFVAETEGTAGNLDVGTELRWVSPPPGLDAKVVLTTALKNGAEEEEDLPLLDRELRRMQLAPKGGAAADWREWAETSVDTAGRTLGIVRAWVFPHRNGTGSVDVVAAQAGSGTGRQPSAGTLAALLAHLKRQKIVTDSVRVFAPHVKSSETLRIALRVRPELGYEYDWDDTTLAASDTGTGTSLVITSATPPLSLKTAIDNGLRPRIQLVLPAASPLPTQRRVTAYQDNTPAAGKCTLTLDAALPVAVGMGENVYAGGDAVEPVALATLGYIDSLGPSRKSGYADPLDVWDSVVTVSRIAQTALNVKGIDGRPVLLYAPDFGVGVGCTIQVGSGGAAVGADFAPNDNSPTAGPEIATVYSLLVRRG